MRAAREGLRPGFAEKVLPGDPVGFCREWLGYEPYGYMWPFLRDGEHFARLRWRRDRLFRIRAIAARIIRTDLYLTGPPYPGPK